MKLGRRYYYDDCILGMDFSAKVQVHVLYRKVLQIGSEKFPLLKGRSGTPACCQIVPEAAVTLSDMVIPVKCPKPQLGQWGIFSAAISTGSCLYSIGGY